MPRDVGVPDAFSGEELRPVAEVIIGGILKNKPSEITTKEN